MILALVYEELKIKKIIFKSLKIIPDELIATLKPSIIGSSIGLSLSDSLNNSFKESVREKVRRNYVE